MKFTLAFTTYNSYQFIEQQLSKDYFAMSEGLIDEIVIQDDFSDDFLKLKTKETENIKIYQNSKRLLPLLSRPELLKNCKNEWVLLMDSDNFLTTKSFNSLKTIVPQPGVIYMPGFAEPDFNFRSQYPDTFIDLKLAANRVGQPGANWMNVLLNTGNYLVPKREYLEVVKTIDPTLLVCPCEVLYFNYLWLKAGKKLFCKSDYEYFHTQRPDSFYRTYCADTRLPDSLYELYYQYR
jgi:glycosyltransferase involved in cell wall biosynthesis